MTEPRALDEPLTDAELDELEGFLASDAVPQDCMDLEMLDGFLTAIVQRTRVDPAVRMAAAGVERRQPQRGAGVRRQRPGAAIMGLVLRHMVGIQRTLGESPTRFKPLLYLPEEKAARRASTPPEATAWCEGYMAGVKLRDDEWQPLYDAEDARDWIFPIEALAFGDHDPEFAEWVDSDEKRDEHDRGAGRRRRAHLSLLAGTKQATQAARHRQPAELPDAARKSRERLH